MRGDGATVNPNVGYGLCVTAEKLGKSLREFLTGETGPLTCMEWLVMQRYRAAQMRFQQQAR